MTTFFQMIKYLAIPLILVGCTAPVTDPPAHAFETYTKYSAYHPLDTKIAEIAQDEYEHSKELQKAMLMIA